MKLTGYVINLDREPGRLQKFLSQTEASFFQRMPAVDKKLIELFDLDNFFDTARFLEIDRRSITAGEIGCTLSHIACWKAITHNKALIDDDFAIVAEDDVILCDNFSTIVSNVIVYLKQRPDVDVLILQKLGIFDLKWRNCLYKGEDEIDLFKISSYNNDGSALYLIRKSCARALTERVKSEKPYWLADWFDVFGDHDRTLVASPLLGYVAGGVNAPSDLELDRQVAYTSAGYKVDRI